MGAVSSSLLSWLPTTVTLSSPSSSSSSSSLSSSASSSTALVTANPPFSQYITGWRVLGLLSLVYLYRRLKYLTQPKHLCLLSKSHLNIGEPQHFFPQFFRNDQGLWICTYQRIVAQPKAFVFMSHGFGEHFGRYEHVVRLLVQSGYSVYGMDHQGHGHSDGDRGYVERFHHYINDFVQFVKAVQTSDEYKQSNVPCFLFGHSMGGTIAVEVALKTAEAGLQPWSGVILSAPAIIPHPKIATPFKIQLCRTLSNLLPKLQLDPIGPESVSRHPQVVARYREDPLVFHGGSFVRWAAEALSTLQHIQNNLKNFTAPYLFVHGTGDIICDESGAHFFHKHAASTDKTLKLYPGLYHEVLNEYEWKEVAQDIVSWLNAHA